MIKQSPLRPFLAELHDTYRTASHRDYDVTPQEVQQLLLVWVSMWSSAQHRIPSAQRSSLLAEIATELQPAGRNDLHDPLEAARGMNADMQIIADAPPRGAGLPHPAGDERYAGVRRRYGNLAGCAHAIMRVLALLMDQFDGGELDTILAQFIPMLAPAIVRERPPQKAL